MRRHLRFSAQMGVALSDAFSMKSVYFSLKNSIRKRGMAMEHNNRPQGREKYVTNNSKGTARRGEGLNLGSVGNGSRPGQQANKPGQ